MKGERRTPLTCWDGEPILGEAPTRLCAELRQGWLLCLFDARSARGAMSVLRDSGQRASEAAVERLVAEMQKRGSRRRELVARVMGDAHADALVAYLDVEGVQVAATDFGGGHARQVTLDTASGTVDVIRTPLVDASDDEADTRQTEEGTGSVELF